MADNPFSSYNVEIPKKYAEDVKKFCKTAGGKATFEYAPFKRQVDFWYFCFLLAVQKELEPAPERDTSNITPASILSGDSYRITHIQLAYLGHNNDLSALADHRGVFDYALNMANAGMPYALQILNDPDDKPLWALLDDVETKLA
ncbi:hypothetical protein [Haliea salexigens]|uniref:hypothetical protein n=1 Tax=Haliea salexigens TaxID=287487 RepID=UPI001182FD26|nr:hypothetical protein [Haliea salexigens]